MNTFDRKVIQNIKRYISENNLSIKKIANETKISYHRLWSILEQSNSIKLSDYIAICKACREDFDFFFPKEYFDFD